jgi:hypothetical protein
VVVLSVCAKALKAKQNNSTLKFRIAFMCVLFKLHGFDETKKKPNCFIWLSKKYFGGELMVNLQKN